ncbi:hypothetical protein BDW66DRAFT_137112, partial [Aspergillus desertorum]
RVRKRSKLLDGYEIWFVSAVILNALFQLNYTYSCYECNTAKSSLKLHKL